MSYYKEIPFRQEALEAFEGKLYGYALEAMERGEVTAEQMESAGFKCTKVTAK